MLTSSQRRARTEVVAWAQQRTSDPRTLFLDTETTGLGPGAEIIDLAVVDVAGSILIDTLIAPINPIPPEATTVHGIVDDDVAGAPPLERCLSCACSITAYASHCGLQRVVRPTHDRWKLRGSRFP